LDTVSVVLYYIGGNLRPVAVLVLFNVIKQGFDSLIIRNTRCSFFLLHRKALARCSTSVASYTACRGGVTADDGSHTNDWNDDNL